MSDKIRRTNRHHRRSRARNGDNSPSNLVVVDERHHQAFHLLFPNTHPKEIARLLNDTWIDPAYTMIVMSKEDVQKVLKHLSQLT